MPHQWMLPLITIGDLSVITQQKTQICNAIGIQTTSKLYIHRNYK